MQRRSVRTPPCIATGTALLGWCRPHLCHRSPQRPAPLPNGAGGKGKRCKNRINKVRTSVASAKHNGGKGTEGFLHTKSALVAVDKSLRAAAKPVQEGRMLLYHCNLCPSPTPANMVTRPVAGGDQAICVLAAHLQIKLLQRFGRGMWERQALLPGLLEKRSLHPIDL